MRRVVHSIDFIIFLLSLCEMFSMVLSAELVI